MAGSSPKVLKEFPPPHPTLPLSKHKMGERSFRLSKDQAGSSLEFMDEVGCSANLLLTAVHDLKFHQT